MINYIQYIKENNSPKIDGKYGFFLFLKLIDDLKLNFIKTSNYLNTGKYQFFFTTENIKNKENFVGYFNDSLSLKTTCDTAKKIKDLRISCYFGIKNNILEYGFQDDMNKNIYKTGEFNIDNKYIKSLNSYKCLSLIDGILKRTNLINLNLLQEVKSALKFWYENEGNILILNDTIIKKSIDKNELKDELTDVNKLLYKYETWCEKFKWYNKVYYYLDSDDEDMVTFYIKIKPKTSKIDNDV